MNACSDPPGGLMLCLSVFAQLGYTACMGHRMPTVLLSVTPTVLYFVSSTSPVGEVFVCTFFSFRPLPLISNELTRLVIRYQSVFSFCCRNLLLLGTVSSIISDRIGQTLHHPTLHFEFTTVELLCGPGRCPPHFHKFPSLCRSFSH